MQRTSQPTIVLSSQYVGYERVRVETSYVHSFIRCHISGAADGPLSSRTFHNSYSVVNVRCTDYNEYSQENGGGTGLIFTDFPKMTKLSELGAASSRTSDRRTFSPLSCVRVSRQWSDVRDDGENERERRTMERTNAGCDAGRMTENCSVSLQMFNSSTTNVSS